MRRAVKDEDKLKKRRKLIAAAAALLLKDGPDRVSMARIATKARVAKGTLYLYFRTKEEIFLAVLGGDLESWCSNFVAYLESQPAAIPPGELAAWITNSLRSNRRFVHGLAIAHAVLECNVSTEAARAYKRVSISVISKIVPQLIRVLDIQSVAAAISLLAQVHGLVHGLWSYAEPTPVVAKLLRDDEFAVLKLDYFAVLETGLQRLFAGSGNF
jgi:AcrR family transcriptional regulator